MKNVVVYFSASGVTRKLAQKISEKLKCDIYEIVPVELYTKADLNWMNKNSRSSIEMKDKKSRPKFKEFSFAIDEYDVIYLGFPIWWYTAPRIINTFLESYNFKDKKIIMFATSGSSGFENSKQDVEFSVDSSNTVVEGKVNPRNLDWIDNL